MPLSMFGEGRAEVQGRDEESKDEGSQGTEGSVSRVCLKRQRPESWGPVPEGRASGTLHGDPSAGAKARERKRQVHSRT